MKVHQLLADSAARWPDRVALYDEAGAITFQQLHEAAEALREDLEGSGLRPGDGIGVMCRNGREFVVAVFAGLAAGAVVMPMSHQLARGEVADLLERVPLRGVLDYQSGVAPPSESPVSFPVPHARAFRWGPVRPPSSRPLAPHLPDAAFIRFTSGTTGASKGVVIGHQGVLARTASAQAALGLDGARDVVVWVLPMAYHFIVSVVMYVRYGVPIAVCDRMMASAILDAAQAHQGTVLYASPTHYRLLAADTSGRRLDRMRMAISTSTALPRDVADAFGARFGLPILQVYGIIEIGLPCGNLTGEGPPDSIGKALVDHEVRIVDDEGDPVPEGQEGHLVMRGPGLFDGYLTPPQTREEVLRNGWFWTGDLARRDDAGFVTVCGRRKSMINVAGLKVFPEEVEAVLNAHEGVVRSRVYGRPHPLMGEVVVAEVVPVARGQLDSRQLRLWCRERLSAHKVPHEVDLVESVAMTVTGKIRRSAEP